MNVLFRGFVVGCALSAAMSALAQASAPVAAPAPLRAVVVQGGCGQFIGSVRLRFEPPAHSTSGLMLKPFCAQKDATMPLRVGESVTLKKLDDGGFSVVNDKVLINY